MTNRELDERVGLAELRGEMAQMNRRLDDQLTDMNRRLDDQQADIQDIRATLRWLIGIQVTMFIVLGGLLIQTLIVLLRISAN